MGVTALVMAGGKGSRMQHPVEKPLIRIGGKPIIERVIRALQNAKEVESIIVAISNYTPKTSAFVSRFPVKVAWTPGKDYINDMQYLVKQLDLGKVLTVAADIPLISGGLVDEIVKKYKLCGKPALAVVTSSEIKQKLGLGNEHSFQAADEIVVPVGINIIDGQRIDEEELEQEVFRLDRIELAVNINTLEELNVAERLVKNS